MRKIMARGFALEFVSLLALIVTVTLAWIGGVLKLPAEVVISASVGIAVAAYIWVLKWELTREIQEKSSLYNLLETIEDEDLYERGKTAIEECRVELENLSKGLLRIDPGHFYRTMIKYTDSVRHHLRATHIALDERQMKMWIPDMEHQWYQHNIDLVKRGVLFERWFILSRSYAIDSASGKLRQDLSTLLQKQARDGIKVQVVWVDELDDRSLIQDDFIVVDTDTVYSAIKSWVGGYFNITVSRRKVDVYHYIEIFDALRAKGQSLQQLHELLPASGSDQASPTEETSK
jgi:hypothetical protein